MNGGKELVQPSPTSSSEEEGQNVDAQAPTAPITLVGFSTPPQATTILAGPQPPVPVSISIISATAPTPILNAPSSTPKTVTITSTAQATTTGSGLPSPSPHHGLDGITIAEILVPLILVAALIPILVFSYLHWRHKPDRRRPPELRFPPETSLLNSRSHSMSITSPFVDAEEIGLARSTSQPSYRHDRTSTEISHSASPMPRIPSIQTFPSPMYEEDYNITRERPRTITSAMYAEEALLPDPPPPYAPQTGTLRPPSSFGRVRTRSRSPSLTEANMSNHNMRFPFSDAESDTVSDISSEHGSVIGRRRYTDELSIVSALDSGDPLDPHNIV